MVGDFNPIDYQSPKVTHSSGFSALSLSLKLGQGSRQRPSLVLKSRNGSLERGLVKI